MKYLTFGIFALLAGCATDDGRIPTQQILEVRLHSEVLPDGRGPSVEEINRMAEVALSGDQLKLRELLQVAEMTDGEGALTYGAFLLKVRGRVGNARFDRALNQINPRQQEAARQRMDSAEKMQHLL